MSRDIAELWRRGSVIGSWLLDLTAMALVENPTLSNFTGFVEDSGEGRWTIDAAIEEAVPVEVLASALFTRFRSRRNTRSRRKFFLRCVPNSAATSSGRPAAIHLLQFWPGRRDLHRHHARRQNCRARDTISRQFRRAVSLPVGIDRRRSYPANRRSALLGKSSSG